MMREISDEQREWLDMMEPYERAETEIQLKSILCPTCYRIADHYDSRPCILLRIKTRKAERIIAYVISTAIPALIALIVIVAARLIW